MSRGRGAGLLRWLRSDPSSAAAALALLAVVVAALVGPALIDSSPTRVELGDRLLPPVWEGGGWGHPLGTDALGRDMLARLLGGARVSLLIGVTAVAGAAVVGTLAGMLAGYRGGLADTVVMRLADAQLAFPGLVLVLAVVGALGPSVTTIIVVLVALGWMVFARVARSLTAHLRHGGHVRSAEIMGCSRARLLLRHLLPAVSGPLLTQAMLELGKVMLTEASLSYLGLGVQPPDASWGLMVAENQPYLSSAWWAVTLPGLALAGCVLLTNVVAGGLRVRLDPVQRQLVGARRARRRAAEHVPAGGAVSS